MEFEISTQTESQMQGRHKKEPGGDARLSKCGLEFPPSLSSAVRAVVAVVAAELVSRGEGLGSVVICVKRSRYFGNRLGCALVVGAVAVGASWQVALRIVVMTVNPRLADGVAAVRSAIRSDRHAGVANAAFGDLRDVSLQLCGIDAVIGLQSRILRVRRAVAGRAENRAVARAVAIQVGSGNWHVRVGGESLVRDRPPVSAAVERRWVTLGVLVAELTGGFNQPGVARGVPGIGQCAVAARAQHLIHGAALALRLWPRMAQVARLVIVNLAVLVESLSVRLENLRTVQRVHIAGLGANPSQTRKAQSIVAMARRAQHRSPANRGLIESGLVGVSIRLELA